MKTDGLASSEGSSEESDSLFKWETSSDGSVPSYSEMSEGSGTSETASETAETSSDPSSSFSYTSEVSHNGDRLDDLLGRVNNLEKDVFTVLETHRSAVFSDIHTLEKRLVDLENDFKLDLLEEGRSTSEEAADKAAAQLVHRITSAEKALFENFDRHVASVQTNENLLRERIVELETRLAKDVEELEGNDGELAAAKLRVAALKKQMQDAFDRHCRDAEERKEAVKEEMAALRTGSWRPPVAASTASAYSRHDAPSDTVDDARTDTVRMRQRIDDIEGRIQRLDKKIFAKLAVLIYDDKETLMDLEEALVEVEEEMAPVRGQSPLVSDAVVRLRFLEKTLLDDLDKHKADVAATARLLERRALSLEADVQALSATPARDKDAEEEARYFGQGLISALRAHDLEEAAECEMLLNAARGLQGSAPGPASISSTELSRRGTVTFEGLYSMEKFSRDEEETFLDEYATLETLVAAVKDLCDVNHADTKRHKRAIKEAERALRSGSGEDCTVHVRKLLDLCNELTQAREVKLRKR